MALHLIKLCVGVNETEELAEWQKLRLKRMKRVYHVTRMVPRRAREVLDGGSLYWVIRGLVQVRQRIVEIEPFRDEDGIERCRLVFDPRLVPVHPQPRRAFQGWRYLAARDAPADLPKGARLGKIPPAMRRELMALGLIG